MKLLRVGPVGQERPAVLVGDHVVDVSDLIDDFDSAFFAAGGIAELSRAVDARGTKHAGTLDGVRVGPPVARPSKLVCIGLNYADHAAEAGHPVPSEPTVFFKAPNTIVGPYDDVHIPVGGCKTDWEVEMAVVIGKRARYLENTEAAAAAIAGLTISNDVSERAFQLERGGQWCKGKSCETFNPLGPYLVTLDEVADPHALGLWLEVNGERVQDSTTAEMVYTIDHLVWYLSQFMVLEPGDIINTGTPAGVGLGSGRYLQDGDVMRLGVDLLGVQQQTCCAAAP